MSNHVHLIVIPKQLDSLAATLKNTHGRYAAYWNAQHTSSRHVGQGRFYSCPLGGAHLAHLGEAWRHTELNPARAGMVAAADSYPWSGAARRIAGYATLGAILEVELLDEKGLIARLDVLKRIKKLQGARHQAAL
jgi:putative transposase